MNNADKPAYPFHYDNGLGSTHEDGLTKRERFAMAAMQGLGSNPEFAEYGTKAIAEISVKQADALLKQLEDTQ